MGCLLRGCVPGGSLDGVNMKFNIEFVLGIALICFLTGLVIPFVGKVLPVTEPCSWWLPIQVLFILAFPFFLGYSAGKRSRD